MPGRKPPVLPPQRLRSICKRYGLKPIQPLAGGQHLVWRIRYNNKDAVIKLRAAEFGRRLEKEAYWLKQLPQLGIKGPKLLHHIQDTDFHAIIIRFIVASRSLPLSPLELLHQLRPLHNLRTVAGWGPLRADLLPRWRDEETALNWYISKANELKVHVRISELLKLSWPHRQHGLIHGDCHRQNLIGRSIIDWESVAQVDPFEEAARMVLARPWPIPWQWLNCSPTLPRWQGAWIRTCLESAAFPGPRQRQAVRELRLIAASHKT